MSKLKPISWDKLVIGLRLFGFEGPFYRGKHPYMIRDIHRITIPNPHKKKDISIGLLSEILLKAGISREELITRS